MNAWDSTNFADRTFYRFHSGHSPALSRIGRIQVTQKLDNIPTGWAGDDALDDRGIGPFRRAMR
jgi:hypothetical protein